MESVYLAHMCYVILGSKGFLLYHSSKNSQLHSDHTFNLSQYFTLDLIKSIILYVALL